MVSDEASGGTRSKVVHQPERTVAVPHRQCASSKILPTRCARTEDETGRCIEWGLKELRERETTRRHHGAGGLPTAAFD